MKKVLFIMPDLPSGGAEKLLIDVLKRIDNSRYQVSLLLEYRQGVYLNDIPSHVEVLSIHGENNIWRERLHRGLRMIHCYGVFHSIVYRCMELVKLRGRSFDTIVSFMEGSAVKFHSYITHKASRNVSWVHIDFQRKHWSLEFFQSRKEEHAAYGKMDRVVFVSGEAQKGFMSVYPFDKSKCQVLYNLIDKKEIVRQADSLEVPKKKFTIAMVGRLNEQKRYDRALDAVRILKDGGLDFELWILGEGHLERELKAMCRDLEINDHVEFLGFKKPSYAYMKVADLFLNTSEAEGYPLTICEALCLGLPIVATDITGAREILGDSKYGLLVNESPKSIATGLKELICDDVKRTSYAEAASEGSRQFDVEQIMNKIYQII